MEVVGSIASITQLLRYALSLIATISSIYKNIQGGPALQHQRLKQLERLFCTVQTLNETSALNKASTKEHLTAIVVRIQDLRVLLDRLAAHQTGRPIKKYLKALVKENREQNRILEVFIDLEKEKSALLLSIAETHTELSAKIYNKLFEQSPPCTQGNSPSETCIFTYLNPQLPKRRCRSRKRRPRPRTKKPNKVWPCCRSTILPLPEYHAAKIEVSKDDTQGLMRVDQTRDKKLH